MSGKVYEDIASNMMMVELKMSVNALYRVLVQNNTITLTLYDTVSAAKLKLPENDISSNFINSKITAIRELVISITFT